MPENPAGMKEGSMDFLKNMEGNKAHLIPPQQTGPDGGRGYGPSIDNMNHMGIPKDLKDLHNSHISNYNKNEFDENMMNGKQHGRKVSEKEEFYHRFMQLWQAYADEPGLSQLEKE